MTEHYVSMEQAKRLHDLGFDGVDKYYVTESFCYGGNPDDFYQEGQMVDEYIVYFINEDNEDDYRGVPAPRLDQAAAWMRDCKGIDIEVVTLLNPVKMNKRYKANLCYFGKDEHGEDYANYKVACLNVHSYENALSIGIDKALELLGKEVKE